MAGKGRGNIKCIILCVHFFGQAYLEDSLQSFCVVDTRSHPQTKMLDDASEPLTGRPPRKKRSQNRQDEYGETRTLSHTKAKEDVSCYTGFAHVM